MPKGKRLRTKEEKIKAHERLKANQFRKFGRIIPLFFFFFFILNVHAFAINYTNTVYTSIGSQGYVRITTDGVPYSSDNVSVTSPFGSRVLIEALPFPGYTFSSWDNDFSTQKSTFNLNVDGTRSGTASFQASVASPLSIGNKCVSRVISLNASKSKVNSLNNVSVSKIQIYVIEGDYGSFSLPVSPEINYPYGLIFKTTSQSFYYTYRSNGALPSGSYLASSNLIQGSGNKINMGGNGSNETSAPYVTSDIRYSCNSSSLVKYQVSVSSNLPANIASQYSFSGSGYYNNHSSVTVTAPNVVDYKFLGFSSVCGNTAHLLENKDVLSLYKYTIADLVNHCEVLAQYVYSAPISNQLYQVTISIPDGGGSVKVNGSDIGGAYVATVKQGTILNVEAIPSSGKVFSSWTDSFFGKSSTFSYQVMSNVSSMPLFVNQTVTNNSLSCSSPNITIKSNYDGAGSFSGIDSSGVTPLSSSFPFNFNAYARANGSLCTYNITSYIIENYGFTFRGWTGNFSTTTMDKLNNTGVLDLTQADGGTELTAQFELNGNPNGSVINNILTRPIASSPQAIFTSDLSSYSSNMSNAYGALPDSPYRIDGKCVSGIARFQARETNWITSIFPTFAKDINTYELYALDGSLFTLEKSSDLLTSGVYTFKSDPSEWYMRISSSKLPSGDYSSDSSIFSAHSNKFSFVEVRPLEDFHRYNCNEFVSINKSAPISSLANLQSMAFENVFDGIYYSVSTSDILLKENNGVSLFSGNATSSPYYDNVLTKLPYQRIKCSQGQGGFRINTNCPVSLNSALPDGYIKDYRYIWVFSSAPVKSFFHQFSDVNTSFTGLYVYNSDKNIPIRSGDPTLLISSTNELDLSNASSSSTLGGRLPLYASRIDLSVCRYYKDVIDFRNGIYTSCLTPFESNYKDSGWSFSSSTYGSFASLALATEMVKNNGIMFGTSTAFSDDVLFYTIYYTSNSITSFSEGSSVEFVPKVFDRLERSRYATNFLNNLGTNFFFTQATTSVFQATTTSYVATSTVNGYYVSTTTNTQLVATSSIRAYYKLDESSGNPSDSSGNGYTLTNNNSVSYVTGKINNGVDFGSSNSTKYFSHTSLHGFTSPTQTHSLCAWFKVNTAPSNDSQMIVSQFFGETTGGDWKLYYNDSSGTKRLYATNDGAGSISYTTTLSTGVFYHSCITFSGSDVASSTKLYLNGSEVGSGNLYGTTNYNAYEDSFTIGANRNGSSLFFKGVIDEVVQYNRALTSSEVSYLYNSGSGLAYPFYGNATTTSYVATSTVNGYYVEIPSSWVSATSTFYNIGTSSMFLLSSFATSSFSGVYTLSSESYSSSLSLTGFSSLSSYTNSLYAQFDPNDPVNGCYLSNYSLAKSFGCLISKMIGSTFITLTVPSESQLKVMHDGLNDIIKDNGAPLTVILSAPLRMTSYADLNWKPATTTALTIGMSSTSKVTIMSSANSPLATADNFIHNYIYPFMLIGLVIVVSLGGISLFL